MLFIENAVYLLPIIDVLTKFYALCIMEYLTNILNVSLVYLLYYHFTVGLLK